jgi:hypothetical protein
MAASCDCGVPYITATQYAVKALAKHPEKSNVMLAAESGVSRETIRRARKTSTCPNVQVEKRVGKDGRTRSVPKPKPKVTIPHTPMPLRASDPIQETCEDCDTVQEHWERSLSNLAGDAISMPEFWTRQFGDWHQFNAPSSLVTLAKQAAKAWTKLAADLTKTK